MKKKKSMKWKRTKTKVFHSLLLNTIHCQSLASQGQYRFDWVSSSHLNNIRPHWINEPSVRVILGCWENEAFFTTMYISAEIQHSLVESEDKYRILVRITLLQQKVLYYGAITAVLQSLYGNHPLVYNSSFTQKFFFKWLRVFLLSITS